ncbi:DUF6789 family protein [Brevundimonas sp.]|uniref:DUF6789 family protein n=1 Tax=Brevundimonas sp. TaxID=1871086 RepID=UPI003AF9E060
MMSVRNQNPKQALGGALVMMSRVYKGMIAGFVAAVAVAALEALQLWAGPWVAGFPRLVTVMFGIDSVPWIGWAGHFLVGTLVLGPLFGILCPRMPTEMPETKGVVFAVGAFMVMGLTIAPLTGIGMFGMRAGFFTVAWLVLTHVVFGVVLGNVYARMVGKAWRRERVRDHVHLAH